MMMEQVTQADDDAAKAMLEHAFRHVGVRALKDVRFADIAEHFAKHRLAERAECIRIVDEFDTFSGEPRDDAVRDVMAVDLQRALGAFRDELAMAAEQSYAADNDRGGAPLSWLAAAVVNKNSAIESYGQAAWDSAYARAAQHHGDTHV